MGLCGSKYTPDEMAAAKASRDLDSQNIADLANQQNKIRLLLLGAGESGKSTIFKQMRILYGAGFSDQERHQKVSSIHHNTISFIKILCSQASELGHDMTSSKEEFETAAWATKSDYQIIESNAKYMTKIEDISKFGYLPSDEDILLSRVRTTGIVEENYVIDGANFVIIDVGGQRNERKKWIHCFEDVNAIIFVAALSEYDQKLFEDSSQNRMVEALTLFGEMCNSRWFERTDMILFLNKVDLFRQKVGVVDIKSIEEFADYTGGGDEDAGVNYFLDAFVAKNEANKDIYSHVTCATDSNNVKVVFEACRDIILKKNLEDSGFMS